MNKSPVRRPAVAGAFYPAEPSQLHEMIAVYLKEAPQNGKIPKAIVAPHAGYIYSGPIAASVYARIAQAKGRITRVVLLGPSHRIAFRGVAVTTAEAYSTPLGSIRIDHGSIARLAQLPQVQVLDQAHMFEHSLEVQLPFLQEVLGDFSLVPLVVGDAPPEEVAEVLEILWGGAETLIVISSDLSHYHDYLTAKQLDAQTTRAIEALDPNIDPESACGRAPLRGLLVAAQKHGLHAHAVDLRNSGDTAGPRDEVVGYGGYVFEA